jgi:formylmethanofuran dehydrogenase subunit D
MPQQFIFIPGRTSRQGTALNEGKYSDEYIDETGFVQMTPSDMQRLGISEGGRARIWNEIGEITATIRASKGDELPDGMLFVSYGDLSCRLMAADTHGSGMPDSKSFDVWVEAV